MTDTRTRQAYILGTGQRIAPLDLTEMTDDLATILAPMITINDVVGSREAEMLTDIAGPAARGEADMAAMVARLPEIMRTMLRHPDLFARQAEIGIQLLKHGTLPDRDRELAILRIGWLCGAPYEWGEHVLIAKKVGVTDDEVAAVTIGSAAPDWSDHDRAILRAVEELHRDAMISDATWATLAERYDERQLIELPIVIGQYQTVAYTQNALRIRLHHDNPGLEAR